MEGDSRYLDQGVLSTIVAFYENKLHPEDIALVLQTSIGEEDREPLRDGNTYSIVNREGVYFAFNSSTPYAPKLQISTLDITKGLYGYSGRNQIWYTLTALAMLAREGGVEETIVIKPLVDFMKELFRASSYFASNDFIVRTLHDYLAYKGQETVMIRTIEGNSYLLDRYDPQQFGRSGITPSEVEMQITKATLYPVIPYLSDLSYFLYYFNIEAFGKSGMPYILKELDLQQS